MIPLMLLIIVSIFLIYVGLKFDSKECPPAKIEYRYIPRSFKEERENPVPINDIFGSMFTEPTVGVIASDYRIKRRT